MFFDTESPMRMQKWLTMTILAATLVVCAPSRASAEWLFTPFAGMNWGGSANFGDVGSFDDEFEKRGTFGASFAMGEGVAGFEIDFGWSPNFFENTSGGGDFEFGDNNVTTFMGNFTLGMHSRASVRPYALGGAGIIKTRAQHARDLFDVASTDWGFNLGAGLIGFFGDSVGLRADFRYFRSLQDHEEDDDFDVGLSGFQFWRGSLGLTFRF
jgi:hypothetical protein